MTDNTQPEALRLANVCSNLTRYSMEAHVIAAELRRQHTRIAELEAQIESIGAGGVSGPLMGCASIAASAGSEAVATVFTMEALAPGGGVKYHATVHKPLPAGTKLYTHPSPPEGMVGGWISVDERMPEPGTPVLLDIGKKYPIRAMWAAKHTVQAAEDDTDWGEYVEDDDMYYAPEGWYEWNECEDNHWRVTETPRAWAPLPPTTSAGSEKGE